MEKQRVIYLLNIAIRYSRVLFALETETDPIFSSGVDLALT
eukprot:SAG11_NODE_15928_length_562_cov_1.107991_1_plen_40_part_10